MPVPAFERPTPRFVCLSQVGYRKENGEWKYEDSGFQSFGNSPTRAKERFDEMVGVFLVEKELTVSLEDSVEMKRATLCKEAYSATLYNFGYQALVFVLFDRWTRKGVARV